MKPLSVLFDLSGNNIHDEMRIAPPYDWLVWFISSSIGHDVEVCRFYLKHLAAALAGTPTPQLDGNMLEIAADATTATITNLYDEDNVHTYPTVIVHEAVERWMQFLIDHDRDAVIRKTP